MTEGVRSRQKADRRERLLREAARLFAERGFHGVSIEDLGSAVDISGPAVYRHFPNKDAVLAALLVGVSRRLLEGGRQEASAATATAEALRRLIAFHTAFALSEPELISVQDRDLPNLSAEAVRQVRRLQREYVEVWVDVLTRLQPDMPPAEARTRALAVFGLINSTPHSTAIAPHGTGGHVGEQLDANARALLERMALAALTARQD
jgi:AcrR family transcriptional regulator